MNEKNILDEDFSFLHKHYDFSALYEKTILITGASGLIGLQLIRFLLYLNEIDNAGVHIIAVMRDGSKLESIIGHDKLDSFITVIQSDILSMHNEVDCSVDYVIHGASPTSSQFFVTNPVETIDIAVNGTLNMLRFSQRKAVESFVYLSSMEVFGITNPDLEQVREEDYGYINILNPRSSYPEGKRLCECLCSSFSYEYALPVKIARLTQTLGPGISYNDPRVAAQFARSVIECQDIILKTEGKMKRPIVYIRDAIAAILLILIKGKIGQSYTVANPKTFTTIRETAQMVAEKIAENNISVVYDIDVPSEYAPNLNLSLNLNVDKLCSLGWQPSVGLEDSYRRMIAGMKQYLKTNK